MNPSPQDGRDIREKPAKSIPELMLVGKTEIQKALPPLNIKADSESLNIYFGYKGSKEMECQGKLYSLSTGEFFITPPGVDHSTGPMPISKCAHYWLRINLNLTSSFLSDSSLESVRKKFKTMKVTHGRYSEQLLNSFRNIYDLSTCKQSVSRDLELRLQLCLFLLKLSECTVSNKEQSFESNLSKVKEFLKLHIGEDLSVKDMANVMGCSNTALTLLFKKCEGISPAEYFTQMKMRSAKDMLLKSSVSIKDISEQLGYANARYFSTVFKKYYLVSPGSYRAKNNF